MRRGAERRSGSPASGGQALRSSGRGVSRNEGGLKPPVDLALGGDGGGGEDGGGEVDGGAVGELADGGDGFLNG